MLLSAVLLGGCYEEETWPPGECNEAGVCGVRCLDVGAPIEDFVYVLIEDETPAANDTSGRAGADLCHVALECDRRTERAVQVEWRRGEGLICDGSVVDAVCPPGVNYADPSVVLDANDECVEQADDGSDRLTLLSLGLGGRLLLRYSRPVVGCRLILTLWPVDPDYFSVEYCTAPPEQGGICSHLDSRPGGTDGYYGTHVDDPNEFCD